MVSETTAQSEVMQGSLGETVHGEIAGRVGRDGRVQGKVKVVQGQRKAKFAVNWIWRSSGVAESQWWPTILLSQPKFNTDRHSRRDSGAELPPQAAAIRWRLRDSNQ